MARGAALKLIVGVVIVFGATVVLMHNSFVAGTTKKYRPTTSPLSSSGRPAGNRGAPATLPPLVDVVLEDIGIAEHGLDIADADYDPRKLRGDHAKLNDPAGFSWDKKKREAEEKARRHEHAHRHKHKDGTFGAHVDPDAPKGTGNGHFYDPHKTYAASLGFDIEEEFWKGYGKGAHRVFSSLEDRIRKTTRKAGDKHSRKEGEPKAIQMPDEVPAEYQDLKEATGCDIFTVPFNPADDPRCLDTLSDPRNYKDIVPMEQAMDYRTVKFKVSFKGHPKLVALLKVPQELFRYEPMHEVAAFHADRVLEQNRMPPTVWTNVPWNDIQAAVDKFGAEQVLVDKFAVESNVSNYSQWIAKDVLAFNRRKEFMEKDDPRFPGVECIGASVQVFIAEVYVLLKSDFAIPWELHSDSWQNHLSPSDPWHPEDAIGFIRQAELTMFDWIIANFDRSPNKNNFVVGACKYRRSANEKCFYPRHPGHPSFVTLDNGLAWHHPKYVSMDGTNAMFKEHFCIFEKRFARKLLSMNPGHFSAGVTDRIEKPLRRFFSDKILNQAEERLEQMMYKMSKCAAVHGTSSVFVA
eukprot:TRINITY_DN1115_c0_g1_i1.p1 TRINITY_DN1115_c0_g1~~TRINITY_DN1115_c0_g1_i1.p1  ORF type:complete len:578 (+),score=188.21 TRINITY_DN1115_c0_g1_i1:112-1845(+)